MISAGVDIHSRMGRHSATVSRVMSTEKAAESQIIFPTKRFRSEKSFEPKRCATGMEKPEQMPRQKPMIKKLMDPVEPTAASGPVPSRRPTMIVSTIE